MKIMNHDTGKLFLENTKYRNMAPAAQQLGIPQPPLETEKDPDQEVIKLPDPDFHSVKLCGLLQAINERKSVRKYTADPLTLEELSFLLWCTQGVKSHIPGHATFRTVPSAGARHAFDTYLLVNRVSELPPGLYRFQALEHTILPVCSAEGLANRIVQGALGQEMITSAGVCFIWVAVTQRMIWRYGERGYRYLFLDAGHVCQNLYLSARAVHAGVCAIAAFDDDQMNDVVGVDGTEEFVIYMASVGKDEQRA
jgi:SagB-type dehydrogenase family enzyme